MRGAHILGTLVSVEEPSTASTADVPLVVANRTNDPCWISSDKGVRENILGDY